MNLSKLISSYPSWNVCLTISGGIEVTCDVFRDLVSFVQFKKVWKHPWRRVTFSKSTTPPWVFFPFFKLCKVYQIVQSIKINSLKFACLIIFMDNEKTKIIEIQCTFLKFWKKKKLYAQPAITCTKLTIETLKQGPLTSLWYHYC